MKDVSSQHIEISKAIKPTIGVGGGGAVFYILMRLMSAVEGVEKQAEGIKVELIDFGKTQAVVLEKVGQNATELERRRELTLKIPTLEAQIRHLENQIHK